MAIDYFPTRTLEWKLKMIEAVGESMITGNIAKVQTAPGVYTEFDPRTTQPDQLFDRLRNSILADPDVDTTLPAVQKLIAAGRSGMTRVNFQAA